MKDYKRNEPLFSLCGLNCALCPRFHAEGSSKCPGCGGPDFALKHPTCAFITCNHRHDQVAFCYECSSYPCKRYSEPNTTDSFISYRNVGHDMADAQLDLPEYLKTLKMKQSILEALVLNYNDGRSKGFYCLAVNLLPLSQLNQIISTINDTPHLLSLDKRARAKIVTDIINTRANAMGIELVLRK